MADVHRNLPSVPTPRVEDPSLQRFLNAVAARVNARGLDGLITNQDLVNLRLAAPSNDPRGPGGPVVRTVPLDPTLPTLALPPIPTGFEAWGGIGVVVLKWDDPYTIYANHGRARLYRHTADELNNAVPIGESVRMSYIDRQVDDDTTYYYWVRFETTAGVLGPPTESATATTGIDPEKAIRTLADVLEEAPYLQDLYEPIPADVWEAADLLDEQQQILTEIRRIESRIQSQAFEAAFAVQALAGEVSQTIHTKTLSTESDLTALEARVTNAEGTIIAQATALTALTTRVTDAEGEITAQATALTRLTSRVTTAEGNITAQATALTALTTRVTTAEGNITSQATALTNLTTRVTTAEGNITSQATALTNLTTRVTTAEGRITANASNITSLTSRVTTAEGRVSANATAITSLTTRVTTAEGRITSNASSITSLDTRLTGLGTGTTSDGTSDGQPGIGGISSGRASLGVANYRTSSVNLELNQWSISTTNGATSSGVATTANDAALASGKRIYVSVLSQALADMVNRSRVGNILTVMMTYSGRNYWVDYRITAKRSGTATYQTAWQYVWYYDIEHLENHSQSSWQLDRSGVTAYLDIVAIPANLPVQFPAWATAMVSLEARVSTNEGNITSQATAITNLTTRLTTAEGRVTANANAITSLTTRVTSAEGSITSNASSITSLDTRLTGLGTGTASDGTSDGRPGIGGISSSRVSLGTGNYRSNSIGLNQSIWSISDIAGSTSSGVPTTADAADLASGKRVYISVGSQAVANMVNRASVGDILTLMMTYGGNEYWVDYRITAKRSGSATYQTAWQYVWWFTVTHLENHSQSSWQLDRSGVTAYLDIVSIPTNQAVAFPSWATALVSLEARVSTNEGALARWTVKLQVGDLVGGIGLYNDGTVTRFIVQANHFAVLPSVGSNSNIRVPFEVSGGVVYINNAVIRSGSITGTKIAGSTITGSNIASSAITSVKIADSTIQSTDILNGTIVDADIANGTISGTKIRTATITSSDIADSAITGSKIANVTITAAKIAAATITGTNIAQSTITNSDIANVTITGAKIAGGTITGVNIQSSTIVASDLANSSITGSKIADSTITGAKLSNNTITSAKMTVNSGVIKTYYSKTYTCTNPSSLDRAYYVDFKFSTGELRVLYQDPSCY